MWVLTTTFGGASLALTCNLRCLPVWQQARALLGARAAAFDLCCCCSMVRRSRALWGINNGQLRELQRLLRQVHQVVFPIWELVPGPKTDDKLW